MEYLDLNYAPAGFHVGYCGGEDDTARYGVWISMINADNSGAQVKFVLAPETNRMLFRIKDSEGWQAWNNVSIVQV